MKTFLRNNVANIVICCVLAVYGIIVSHAKHQHLPWWMAGLAGFSMGVLACVIADGLRAFLKWVVR